MRQAFASLLVVQLLSIDLAAQAPAVADYTTLARHGDFIVRSFEFHTGETLPELRLHYVTWGTATRNASGEVTNAVLLLHGTLGAGVEWGEPSPDGATVHPLLGPGAPLDVGKYYVIAPDTIGAGKSSRPSDGLRMRFPRYNLEDIVRAERLLVEHLGVTHLVAVAGASMGGRQTWQWGIQYPDFMDGLVPMISSPFPNTGLRGVIDFLSEQIIKSDPAWNAGNYRRNPEGARLADLLYTIFLRTPSLFLEQLPTREAAETYVRESRGAFGWPDANDFIYMMRLNDGFDAWSQIDRIACPVLIINMAGDNIVPVELGHGRQVARRLKNATYLEVVDEAKYGHGARARTVNTWGPTLREWLRDLSERRGQSVPAQANAPIAYTTKLTSGPFLVAPGAASVDWVVVNNDSRTVDLRVTVFKLELDQPKTPVAPGALTLTLAPDTTTHNANSIGVVFTTGFYYEVVVEATSPRVHPSVTQWSTTGAAFIPGTLIPAGAFVSESLLP
jgi:homoserine O-acetyltransferase